MGACMLFSSLVLGPAEAPLPEAPALVAVLPLLVLLVADADVLGASAAAGLLVLRRCALLLLVAFGPRPEAGLLVLLLAPLFAPSLHEHESRSSTQLQPSETIPGVFHYAMGTSYNQGNMRACNESYFPRSVQIYLP